MQERVERDKTKTKALLLGFFLLLLLLGRLLERLFDVLLLVLVGRLGLGLFLLLVFLVLVLLLVCRVGDTYRGRHRRLLVVVIVIGIFVHQIARRLLDRLDGAAHGVGILARRFARFVEGESLLDLDGEHLAKLGGGRFGEAVDARGDRDLVGEEARHAALVLGCGTGDGRGVVDEAVLGRVAFGLECAEERLFGTEDLDRRGRILGQVGQRTGVTDETGADNLTQECRKVGCDEVHLLDEILVHVFTVLAEVDDSIGKVDDVVHVELSIS